MRITQRIGLFATLVTFVGCGEATAPSTPTPADNEVSPGAPLVGEPQQDCSIVFDDIVINSPADLQPYAQMDCFSTAGSLKVRNTTGLGNLHELHGLRFVGRNIIIDGNTGLESLNGLQNLIYAGQGLVVENNAELQSAALPNLSFVEAEFRVRDNPTLAALDLPALESVGMEFIVAHSPLTQLNFPMLAYVGDDFVLEDLDSLLGADFPALKRLSGLASVKSNSQLESFSAQQLKSIESTLEFLFNDALLTLDLDALDFIGGPVNIIDNASLTNCEIQNLFDSVKLYDIGGYPFAERNGGGSCTIEHPPSPECYTPNSVVISSQADLAQFAGKQCIAIRSNLTIRDTVDVTDLSALSGLRFVGERVDISNNTALQSLNALSNLRFIGMGLRIENNPQLAEANLSGLEVIGTELHILNQPTLKSLDLGSLQVIGDRWTIQGADDLETVNTPALEWIGAQLNFEDNKRLRQVRLDSFAHAIGSLRLQNNPQLQSVDAPQLTHIGQSLYIQLNASLESISLPSLEFVSNQFFVNYNPLIDNCDIYGLVGQIHYYDIGGGMRIFVHNPETCPNWQRYPGYPGDPLPVPGFDTYD